MVAASTLSGSDQSAARLILIVEDDYFIADDLRRSFVKSGMEVIGPVPTVEEAIRLISETARIDAAVLDINLELDGPVFPVADALRARDILFVFATGYDSAAIPDRFTDVKCFEKPCNTDHVLRHLAGAS